MGAARKLEFWVSPCGNAFTIISFFSIESRMLWLIRSLPLESDFYFRS